MQKNMHAKKVFDEHKDLCYSRTNLNIKAVTERKIFSISIPDNSGARDTAVW